MQEAKSRRGKSKRWRMRSDGSQGKGSEGSLSLSVVQPRAWRTENTGFEKAVKGRDQNGKELVM